MHLLNGHTVDDYERCPPGFVPAQDLIEGPLQRRKGEGSGVVNGDGFVVERQVGRHLRVHPDLLLCKRERNYLIRGAARNRLLRLTYPHAPLQVLLQQPLACFRKWPTAGHLFSQNATLSAVSPRKPRLCLQTRGED